MLRRGGFVFAFGFLFGVAVENIAIGAPPACPFTGWAQHRCGVAGCFPSVVPTPAAFGTAFDQLANPMFACCWNGWCQSTDPASCELDRIEATPGPDFFAFYNAGSAGDVDVDEGIRYPNRLFVLDSSGRPINGFYSGDGRRCGYRDPATKVAEKLAAPAQLELFDQALAQGKPPAEVAENCCDIVVLALERTCPTANPKSGVIWTASPSSPAPHTATVTRCTAAESMRVHFMLYDICDPVGKRRARFHGVTSIRNVKQTDFFEVPMILLNAIIKTTYPPGTCPEGFKKGADGLCEIDF